MLQASIEESILYNTKNILLEEKDIYNLLSAYDVNLPINDINVYRHAFINKSTFITLHCKVSTKH